MQHQINECAASAEMPKYRCHKNVWALKIRMVKPDKADPTDGGAFLEIDDGDFAPIRVDREYMEKHKPHDGGYYVVYEDGYKSFSPAKAFESGYTRIMSLTFQQRVKIEKNDLDAKLNALRAFCVTGAFDALPDEEKQRLIEQESYMNGYSFVLARRIEAF